MMIAGTDEWGKAGANDIPKSIHPPLKKRKRRFCSIEIVLDSYIVQHAIAVWSFLGFFC